MPGLAPSLGSTALSSSVCGRGRHPAACRPHHQASWVPLPEAAISRAFRQGVGASTAHSPPWPAQADSRGPWDFRLSENPSLDHCLFYSWNYGVREAARQAGGGLEPDLRNNRALFHVEGGERSLMQQQLPTGHTVPAARPRPRTTSCSAAKATQMPKRMQP